MRYELVTTWYGTFVIDSTSNEVIDKKLFPRDLEEIVERLIMMRSGDVLEEEKELRDKYKDAEMIVYEERLLKLENVVLSKSKPKVNMNIKFEDYGFSKDFFQKCLMEYSRRLTSEQAARDRYVSQTVSALDDIIKIINLMAERLREWYSVHFPELSREIDDHEEFARIVYEYGDYETIRGKLERFSSLVSSGAPIGEEDIQMIKLFAKYLLDMIELRKRLQEYLENLMKDVAPNLTHLLGATLAARLISHAGSLERLATLPASSIQVLGAEKALFRHLRRGARPPKHGVIFMHPYVHGSPRWQRGKIARALATKIAIAARADAFTKQFIAEKLKDDFEKRVAEIKEKYRNPPPRVIKGKKKKKRKPKR
ncbi:MAG: hypothetical protein DRN30_04220 [Thermoplasmata archaeon]|nr:hypothetical protein [Euryarchaeota archaeon]RLF65304.1 MAG: hypothetical protein DRN30_04220 [Thermoplasmata archaeon]